MRTLSQHLIHYAHYHRDPRNIHTHFVGIPLIVLAVASLLAQLPLPGGVSVAHLVTLTVVGFYFWLDLGLGAWMLVAMGIALQLGVRLAATPGGLAWGLGLFALGWVIQFVGHAFEGRKPAFVDDLTGLVIGPLFVLVETLFRLGWYRRLQQEIDQHAGPVQRRTPA